MQSAVAAEVAGYRPCLRCRPDNVPTVPIEEWNDQFITAALGLINEGFLDDHGEIDLAMSLGTALPPLIRFAMSAALNHAGRGAHIARSRAYGMTGITHRPEHP